MMSWNTVEILAPLILDGSQIGISVESRTWEKRPMFKFPKIVVTKMEVEKGKETDDEKKVTDEVDQPGMSASAEPTEKFPIPETPTKMIEMEETDPQVVLSE